MSFFELDGGAKTEKSKKPKATKKAPAKKSSGKKAPAKKSSGKGKKKGGNFLGTVSELFAPAGWENFVTAAGLLALDRTDNYLRKSKDSKKQKGGEEVKMEEEMTGGYRKRSSSRKQRGGSDGHHTVEYLSEMDGEDDMTAQPDTMSQTGGAKKMKSSSRSNPKVKKTVVKKTVRKHKGGAMTEEQQTALYKAYTESQSTNKHSQNETTYNRFITDLLTQLEVEPNSTNIQEAKLVIDYKKQPNGNQSKVNAKTRLNAFYEGLSASTTLFNNNSTQPIPIPGTSGLANNSVASATSAVSNLSVSNGATRSNNSLQSLQFPMSPTGQSGGKKAPNKSFSKKPKSKTKGRK